MEFPRECDAIAYFYSFKSVRILFVLSHFVLFFYVPDLLPNEGIKKDSKNHPAEKKSSTEKMPMSNFNIFIYL